MKATLVNYRVRCIAQTDDSGAARQKMRIVSFEQRITSSRMTASDQTSQIDDDSHYRIIKDYYMFYPS